MDNPNGIWFKNTIISIPEVPVVNVDIVTIPNLFKKFKKISSSYSLFIYARGVGRLVILVKCVTSFLTAVSPVLPETIVVNIWHGSTEGDQHQTGPGVGVGALLQQHAMHCTQSH